MQSERQMGGSREAKERKQSSELLRELSRACNSDNRRKQGQDI